MRPSYELLRLPDSGTDQPASSALRELARAHPRARLAGHCSRSYSGALALVAWHASAVGVDLERVQPADRAFAESICTASELERFDRRLGDDAFVTSLWCSKEALAKALGDTVAYDPRRLESPLGWDAGAAGCWSAAPFVPAPGHVAWLVWSAGAQKSSASAFSAASTRRVAGRR